MKKISIKVAFVAIILISKFSFVNAQPIPVELMLGNKYGTFMLIVNKKFSEQSKFGVFHINILQFDYIKNQENDIMLQDLLFYEPIKNLRLTGGGFYGGRPGFIPTLGMQFALKKTDFFMLIAPRVNIEPVPQYDIFTILEYEHKFNEKLALCSGVQALVLFNKNENIKCSQSIRFGLSIQNYQFGAAVDLEQVGKDFEKNVNFGLYMKHDIF